MSQICGTKINVFSRHDAAWSTKNYTYGGVKNISITKEYQKFLSESTNILSTMHIVIISLKLKYFNVRKIQMKGNYRYENFEKS